jgi:hypothetical protein
MDFLAFDARFEEEPINHLLARAQGGPAEVFVLSFVDNHARRVPTMDLMWGAAVGRGGARPMPRAPRPTHDLNDAARHRMNRALRAVRNLGWQAEGAVTQGSLVKAVDQEVRRGHFDEVVLVMDPQVGHRSARWLAIRRLRHLLAQALQ